MLRLLLGLVLCFASCDGAMDDSHDSGPLRFSSLDLSVTIDPGCEVVLFCLPFLPDTFSQCVLPLPPDDNTPAANAFYQCVNAAANGGECSASCGGPDNIDDLGGTQLSAACLSCIEGTCTTAGCAGGLCSSEASACGLGL